VAEMKTLGADTWQPLEADACAVYESRRRRVAAHGAGNPRTGEQAPVRTAFRREMRSGTTVRIAASARIAP